MLPLSHQGTVLALPGRGHIRLGDHVPRQKLRENLGIQAIGFLGRLGDDPELLGIGQLDGIGQRLYELDKPLIAGSGLNNHPEGTELPEELGDLRGLVTVQSLPRQDTQSCVHDADGDNLLVEVDADRVHRRAPSLGNKRNTLNTSSFPQPQRFCKTAASTSLS